MRGDYRKKRDGRLDWRVLVIDQETKATLEGILTVDEIINENIVQIEDIADEERTPSDFPAIYLLSSSHGEEYILRSLKKDFKGEFAPKMFFEEVTGSSKFSTSHFLHNGVKRALENTKPDTSCCLTYLAEALNPRLLFSIWHNKVKWDCSFFQHIFAFLTLRLPSQEEVEEALQEELVR